MKQHDVSLRPTHRIASVLAVSALALGLAACGKKDEPTAGQRLDSAVEKTEQAAADARNQAASAMQSAENKMEQGAASVASAAQDMGNSAQQAANSAMDKLDDATITAQINAGLAKDPDLSAIKINVDTVNGAVTLRGPAVSATARERAEAIAKGVKGVTSVNNQLTLTAG